MNCVNRRIFLPAALDGFAVSACLFLFILGLFVKLITRLSCFFYHV